MNAIAVIEKSLPNGFHNSVIRKFIINNRAGTFKLYLDVDTGDGTNAQTSTSPGILTVMDLIYFIVDDSKHDIMSTLDKGIRISESGPIEELDEATLKLVPDRNVECAFRHYFLLPDFDAYMFISGMDAEFEWGR